MLKQTITVDQLFLYLLADLNDHQMLNNNAIRQHVKLLLVSVYAKFVAC